MPKITGIYFPNSASKCIRKVFHLMYFWGVNTLLDLLMLKAQKFKNSNYKAKCNQASATKLIFVLDLIIKRRIT